MALVGGGTDTRRRVVLDAIGYTGLSDRWVRGDGQHDHNAYTDADADRHADTHAECDADPDADADCDAHADANTDADTDPNADADPRYRLLAWVLEESSDGVRHLLPEGRGYSRGPVHDVRSAPDRNDSQREPPCRLQGQRRLLRAVRSRGGDEPRFGLHRAGLSEPSGLPAAQ